MSLCAQEEAKLLPGRYIIIISLGGPRISHYFLTDSNSERFVSFSVKSFNSLHFHLVVFRLFSKLTMGYWPAPQLLFLPFSIPLFCERCRFKIYDGHRGFLCGFNHSFTSHFCLIFFFNPGCASLRDPRLSGSGAMCLPT